MGCTPGVKLFFSKKFQGQGQEGGGEFECISASIAVNVLIVTTVFAPTKMGAPRMGFLDVLALTQQQFPEARTLVMTCNRQQQLPA